MSTIKPAHFPRVHISPQQPVSRPVHRVRENQQEKVKQVQAARVSAQKHAQQAQQAAAQKNPEHKLEKAIEVLRAKSVELYKPNGAKTRQAAPLGQHIDIKV